MPFDPNRFIEDGRYPATITAGSLTESENQNPQIFIAVDTDNGPISGTMTITTNTIDRVKKTLLDIGVASSAIESLSILDDPGKYLIGLECDIVPEIHEYRGVETWQVKWFNARRKVASASAKQKAADLFRARPAAGGFTSEPQFAPEPRLPEVEVPF